jgi:hypothetical protein
MRYLRHFLWRPPRFFDHCPQKFQRFQGFVSRNRLENDVLTASMPGIVENFACTAAIFRSAATKKCRICTGPGITPDWAPDADPRKNQE